MLTLYVCQAGSGVTVLGAVHVLATDQVELSNQFAKAGTAKFAGIEYRMDSETPGRWRILLTICKVTACVRLCSRRLKSSLEKQIKAARRSGICMINLSSRSRQRWGRSINLIYTIWSVCCGESSPLQTRHNFRKSAHSDGTWDTQYSKFECGTWMSSLNTEFICKPEDRW